jgi:hypothetical protein
MSGINTGFKEFGEKDKQQFTISQKNPTITINSTSDASTYNVSTFSIGSLSGTIMVPDYYGTTATNISRSGAMNHFASFFYGRWPSTYRDPISGIYTIPRVDNDSQSLTLARVIMVNNPTKDQGIYPDTVRFKLTYNGASVTAIDTTLDSLGAHKENINYGYLVDESNTGMKVGTIFYDYGMILLHGGTGTWEYVYTPQTGASADRNYKTSFNQAKLADPELVISDFTFNTTKIITRNIYYCTANHDEFNYTSNPSAQGVEFLQRDDQATTYITTIGLYSPSKELLAVAKVSPPQKKNKYTQLAFQVVLDFS